MRDRTAYKYQEKNKNRNNVIVSKGFRVPQKFRQKNKFKIGDIVYNISGATLDHVELIIYDIRYIDNRALYSLRLVDEFIPHNTKTIECYQTELRSIKHHTNKARLKVGDIIWYDYGYGYVTNTERERRKCEVTEVFYYDDKVNDVFVKLKGFFNFVIQDTVSLRKLKTPLIIISDMDPYGEEDWNED